MISTISPSHIASYLPSHLSDYNRVRALLLTQEIRDKIHDKMAIAFLYAGVRRHVLPHSLFLQQSTKERSSILLHPKRGYPSLIHRPWARRAIAIDGYEVMNDTNRPNGWKTYHLDQIDGLKLLSMDEASQVFGLAGAIEDPSHERFDTVDSFVRNWNYWSRDFLIQTPSQYDLRSWLTEKNLQS